MGDGIKVDQHGGGGVARHVRQTRRKRCLDIDERTFSRVTIEQKTSVRVYVLAGYSTIQHSDNADRTLDDGISFATRILGREKRLPFFVSGTADIGKGSQRGQEVAVYERNPPPSVRPSLGRP